MLIFKIIQTVLLTLGAIKKEWSREAGMVTGFMHTTVWFITPMRSGDVIEHTQLRGQCLSIYTNPPSPGPYLAQIHAFLPGLNFRPSAGSAQGANNITPGQWPQGRIYHGSPEPPPPPPPPPPPIRTQLALACAYTCTIFVVNKKY